MQETPTNKTTNTWRKQQHQRPKRREQCTNTQDYPVPKKDQTTRRNIRNKERMI